MGRPRDVADAGRQRDLIAWRNRQVGAPGRMPDVVVRLRPARGVVADGARAATHTQLVVGGMAGAENRSTQLRFEIAHVDGNNVPQGIALIVGREPSLGVAEEVRALAEDDVPARRAWRALFGDDLYHAT